MADQLTLHCPFEARPQPAELTAFMRGFTRDYITRHRLFDDVDKYTDTVAHFARYCTPPGTSREALAAACRYMAWFLFLDDHPQQSQHLDTFTSIVRGDEKAPTEGPQAALAELTLAVERIARAAELECTEFRERTIAMMQAQHWEHVTLAGRTGDYTEEEYLRYRPNAVGNGAFISIMKLDAEVDADRADVLTAARTRLLEEMTTRLVYLANDILSQHRESADRTALSAVRVLAAASGRAWDEAVRLAIELHDCEMESYARMKIELQRSPVAATREIVKICDQNVSGNLAAMMWIASRYRPKSL